MCNVFCNLFYCIFNGAILLVFKSMEGSLGNPTHSLIIIILLIERWYINHASFVQERRS
jgi:hypothetical protein